MDAYAISVNLVFLDIEFIVTSNADYLVRNFLTTVDL